MRWSGLPVALLLLAAACSLPAGPPTASPRPAALLVALNVQAAERADAAVAFAFSADEAGGLLASEVPEIDFDRQALVCVYLGERPTTGWDLDLQSASVTDGELRIRARETQPRGGGFTMLTYPAGCGLLDRAALPAGELVVRADDTISDEFIVSDTLSVPPAPAAP